MRLERGMAWRLVVMVGLTLAGCATKPIEPISPEQHSAAVCLRDALATSPFISNARVEERLSIHNRRDPELVVKFDITEDGKTTWGELLVFKNEGQPWVRSTSPGDPPFFFSNWRLEYFDAKTGIGKLLAERCPMVPDGTPII